MAIQRCWDCGKQFNVLDDEVGDHSCLIRTVKVITWKKIQTNGKL